MATTSKHPKGLYFLFFAEMWERFGYYLMLGIFTLYLQADEAAGGFGMSRPDSFDIFGTFIALVFLTPFLGGLLADRKLGYRTSITIGGLMMGVGYCLLAVHNLTVFYVAIFLIILGNGFFKPNISTMVGQLYPAGDRRIDSAFTIFYMGINLGAFFSPLVCGSMDFKFGFLAACIGMIISLISFVLFQKKYLIL